MSVRPYALLAFSFDPQRALLKVKQELDSLQDTFLTASSAPLARWTVSLDWIESNFEKYRADIRIFHFAGHAGHSRLQTNFKGRVRYTFADGLARNIGLFGKGLKLVFLNGCSTKDQVDFFLNNGVPAVIATSKPVSDFYACNFARLFYEKFTGGSTLEEAFAAAKNSFDGTHGNFCDRVKRTICKTFLNEEYRSNYEPDDDDESLDIYELYSKGPNLIRNERFADWFPPLPEQETVNRTEDPYKVNGGKHESGYLLCNRDTQKKIFYKILLEKINGRLPAPQFFFTFDTDPNCPQLLPERFKVYALRELFKTGASSLDPDKSTNLFHDLPLPVPELFEEEGAFSDLYKTGLSQIYYEKYGGTAPGDNSLALLQQLNTPLLVVQHRIDYSQWRGTENQSKLETLLRFYLGPYAADLQVQLSERLVVLFQLTLQKSDPYLQDPQNGLFYQLKKDFANTHLLTKLPPINYDNLKSWERDFLEVADNTFLNTDYILTATDPATGLPDPEPREELPFKSTIKRMKDEIMRFNREYHAG